MRRRLGYAAALGLGVAAVEIVILVVVARLIGVVPTVLLVLATSVVGVWVVRLEGLRAWRRFRAATASGRPPGDQVTWGLTGLAGGLLLLLPGFLTDAVGALVLTPPGRRAVAVGVRRAAENRLSSPVAGQVFGPRRVRAGRPDGRTGTGGSPDGDEVIEGEIVDEE